MNPLLRLLIELAQNDEFHDAFMGRGIEGLDDRYAWVREIDPDYIAVLRKGNLRDIRIEVEAQFGCGDGVTIWSCKGHWHKDFGDTPPQT